MFRLYEKQDMRCVTLLFLKDFWNYVFVILTIDDVDRINK